MKLYATSDYSKITLGELLSSDNQAIRRNATGILKQLQKMAELDKFYFGSPAWQKEFKKQYKESV